MPKLLSPAFSLQVLGWILHKIFTPQVNRAGFEAYLSLGQFHFTKCLIPKKWCQTNDMDLIFQMIPFVIVGQVVRSHYLQEK